MTTVLGYIQTGTFSSGGAAAAPVGSWCRPVHRSTCCMAILAGGSCCVCVPTTATCFVIEMWGQGGGGGGGCCCGVGSYGGQGGAYGWVTCTTSGVNHILCACSCLCLCSTCGICNGTYGQFSRVCNCGGPGGYWCVCGGTEGIWCCNPSYPSCFSGCCQAPSSTALIDKYNTWLLYKNCSSALAAPSTGAAASSGFSGSALRFCSTTQTGITPDVTTFTGCAACAAPSASGATAGASILDNISGCLCTCTCFSSPYVWLGACGWSDGGAGKSPFGCLNAQNGITNAQCGGGMSVGGAAYAGGDQAWQKCSIQNCYSCWVQCGNFPGGGGMSTWSQTAWANPGWGAPGLILISWS